MRMRNREKNEKNNLTPDKTSNEMKCCNQCPNHCPVNALHCSRGKEFFGEEGQMAEGHEEHGSREGHEWHRRREDHSEFGQQTECGIDDYVDAGQKDEIDGRTHMRHGRGLKHGRGRENRFGHGSEDHCGKRGMQQPDNLYGSLRMCGHYLYQNGKNGRGGTQERILSILLSRGQISQRELQELLQIQPGSVSEILTKLEMKGLLERNKDEADKRRILLSLTEDGKNAVQKSDNSWGEETLFAVLTEEEQTTLKQLLDKLLTSWK